MVCPRYTSAPVLEVIIMISERQDRGDKNIPIDTPLLAAG